jgi:hypothetical protein
MTSTGQTPTETKSASPRRQRRGPRGAVERVFVRLVATIGIIGIGVGIGAILSSNNVQGWIIGLVVALVTFVLTGLLRGTRQLKP